jgi:hypothetical protein
MTGNTTTRTMRLPTWVRRLLPPLGVYVVCAAAVAVIFTPIALERAVENVHFSDNLGTFPVEVRLCHDGRSTLDTGLFGRVYWDETGPLGFGARARATGPPQAGGTLASYVSSDFIQTNVALIDDPDVVVDAYATKFGEGLRSRFLREELLAALIGGAILFAALPRRRLERATRTQKWAVGIALVVFATGVSAVTAWLMFDDWPCSAPVAADYPMPGVDQLSFSSPETLEVAKQVKPFIEKNTERIERAATEYEDSAQTSFDAQLALRQESLVPRDGEKIVLAEADTQGSFVGIEVRKSMYSKLVDALGRDAFAARTISGDVSSNGTVAEAKYIADEADVGGNIPTVAVGGDHDSETTWKQMSDSGMDVVDLDTIDVADLRFSGANDREHKTLFGGLVTNDSGISEEELGAQLREKLDDEPRIVLLHQPDAVTGYLELDDLNDVRLLDGSQTVPHEDGIPDQVPGTVNIGHRHVLDGPWVLWNTDGDEITWTVVDQLGTAGGVENTPTFNRFSTPVSVPLKPLTVRMQYFDVESGLQTGYATVTCQTDGTCQVTDRVDVGIPGGQPVQVATRPVADN